MKKLIAVLVALAVMALSSCSPIVISTSETNEPPMAATTETDVTVEAAPTTDTYEPEPAARIPCSIIEGLDAPHATHALMYDFDRNAIIYEKNMDERCYPASTTKLLTASVALKYVAPDTVFTVGTEQSLVHEHSSICFIKPGHMLKLSDLILGMMLPSGNDAAYAVAVNTARLVGGNDMTDTEAVAYFCNLMNEYAYNLGATSSHFTSPDGWHDEDHYTTPYDLLLITLDALSHDEIAYAAAAQSEYVVFASGHNVTWTNSNRLLDPEGEYYYRYACGVKTGSTDESGKSLIALAENDQKKELTIIMGCADDDGRYTDTLALFTALLGK